MENINEIICEKRSYSRELKSHQHTFGQFLFPLQGSLEIETDWQALTLDSDYCFYLPPASDHRFHSTDRNEFLILDIPLHYLPRNTSSMYLPVDEQWASIRYLLLEEAKQQEDISSLAALTRYVTNKLQIANPASINYLHRHYKEQVRLETLAEIEHYHPVYYSAWFKKKTGKGLQAYLTELRMNEAKNLLISTGWTMTRISEEIGFENASSFTRWFVRSEGIAPQLYRKLHKG